MVPLAIRHDCHLPLHVRPAHTGAFIFTRPDGNIMGADRQKRMAACREILDEM